MLAWEDVGRGGQLLGFNFGTGGGELTGSGGEKPGWRTFNFHLSTFIFRTRPGRVRNYEALAAIFSRRWVTRSLDSLLRTAMP